MGEENLEEELEKWDKAILLNPQDGEAHFKRGNVLYFLGRKEEALASYDRVLAINPDDDNAHFNRGNVLYYLDRKEEALASYDRALAINPNHDKSHFNKGNVLYELDRKKEALTSYERVISINPDYDKVYFNRGNVLYHLDCKEEALDSYDKTLVIYPDHVNAWVNRGVVLNSLGRKEEALDSYNKALAINPNYDNAHFNRGVVLNSLGRKEEALDSYNRALKGYNRALDINPCDDTSLTNKGFVLISLGKQVEALNCFISAIKINSNNEKAQRTRRFLIENPLFWDNLSEDVEIDLWSGDDNFDALTDTEKLDCCTKEDLQCIHRLWVEQYHLLSLLKADLDQVGHYTSPAVFEILLHKKDESDDQTNPLRLFSLAAANDSMEGSVFQFLLGENCLPSQKVRSNLAVLQASFSSAIDSLNQYRLYGKVDGKEGMGLCLVFDHSFFSKPGETPMIAVQRENDKQSSESSEYHKLPLYWVLYHDRHSDRIYYTPACTEYWLNGRKGNFNIQNKPSRASTRKRFAEIGKCLKNIRKLFQEIKCPETKELALEMLIYLRHLVKDAAFMDEKELRILSLHRYDDKETMRISDGKNCLFRDYLPILHEDGYLKQVIAGPKLENFMNKADVWKYEISTRPGGKKVVFSQSEAPLN